MTPEQTDLPFSRPTFRANLPSKPAEPESLRHYQEKFHVKLAADWEAVCPCCGEVTRKYRRALNSGMARTLIWLVQEWEPQRSDWINVQATAPKYVLTSNEIGKLGSWGLAEQLPSDDKRKRKSGVWRPTRLGVEFVYRRVPVWSHAIFCNREIEKFEGKLIDIRHALGRRFDYDELMKGGISE